MSYLISKPSPFFSQFVKAYWFIENRLPKGKEHIQRIVPSGMTELMFYMGDLPQSLAPDKNLEEPSLLTGQQKGFYDIKVTGHLSLFSIIFHPHGLRMLFDIPLNELFNHNIPLKYVLRNEVSELESKLFESPSLTDRQRIAEEFLLQRIQRSKKNYHYQRMKGSIHLINQSKGIISIDYLASMACLSRKQYERIFRDFVGTSPKQFLKTIRFQNAINEKSKDTRINLTELSYQCGYYDQAHMNGDFNNLTGMSPKKYFSDCEPYSDYFQ